MDEALTYTDCLLDSVSSVFWLFVKQVIRIARLCFSILLASNLNPRWYNFGCWHTHPLTVVKHTQGNISIIGITCVLNQVTWSIPLSSLPRQAWNTVQTNVIKVDNSKGRWLQVRGGIKSQWWSQSFLFRCEQLVGHPVTGFLFSFQISAFAAVSFPASLLAHFSAGAAVSYLFADMYNF